MSTRLARDLASRGITVVSGMARGIDTTGFYGLTERARICKISSLGRFQSGGRALKE
jgi:hypothetical protein